MKLTKILFLSMITALLFTQCTAFADYSRDLTVDLLLNRIDPSNGFGGRYDDEFGGGVGLTYMFNRYVGARFTANYMKLTRNYDGADFGVIRCNLNGKAVYPVLDKLDVSAFGGMGLYLWDADRIWWNDWKSEDGADLGYNWGFGVDYQVWDGIDAGLTYDRHSVELKDSNDRFTWSEISLSIIFHLDPTIFLH